MHILRAERLGTLGCGLAMAVCLFVEGWRHSRPDYADSLTVVELLLALESMPGPSMGSTGFKEAQGAEGVLGKQFPPIEGPIDVAELDSAGWVRWGLTPRQAGSAMRYARAVGGIRRQELLDRMRVLPEGWAVFYAEVLRYPEQGQRNAPAPSSKRSTAGHEAHQAAAIHSGVIGSGLVNINTADSATLLGIRGVGPWVAGRILRARNQWGGIADEASLAEALNGWDSLATALAPQFLMDPADVVPRCADTLSESQWALLPGIGRDEAAVLKRYFFHHRSAAIEEIRHPALDSAGWVTVAHYLVRCAMD